jgi:hypothetical protein
MICGKRVSFDPNGETTIPKAESHCDRTKEQLKSSWYSREELMESTTEAKKIVKIIDSVNGNMEAIDHSRVCVVGLEKFHGKREREKYRRLLIKSVLIRQEMNRGLGLQHDSNCLCEISEMISSSFKEFAIWQAAMHKFHAYESPTSSRAATIESPSPAKRQRLMTGYAAIPSAPDIARVGVQPNPE